MPERTPHTKAEKQAAVHTVMHEFKHGGLHSGSKKGPKVKSRAQAVAIAMSESNQSKKNYDRSAHHEGNPGFPSSSEAGGSPPPKSFQAHEQRERDLLGAGYNLHEKAEQASYLHGGGKLLMSPPSNAQAFSGTHRSGPLRLSGHKGAHQIGKRR